jgi:hypothetical protein
MEFCVDELYPLIFDWQALLRILCHAIHHIQSIMIVSTSGYRVHDYHQSIVCVEYPKWCNRVISALIAIEPAINHSLSLSFASVVVDVVDLPISYWCLIMHNPVPFGDIGVEGTQTHDANSHIIAFSPSISR